MEAVRTLAKCFGIIGIFILPLFAITLGYYLFINAANASKIFDLGNFLTSIVKNILPGFLSSFCVYF